MRAALLAVLLAAACAPRVTAEGAPRAERLEAGGASIQVLHWRGDDAAARQVRAVLPAAVARATRFGRLAAPVTITIHPTHDALEVAVARRGFAWLHAWARYASIDLQSPSTWNPFWTFRPDDREVEDLLAHELAHCAMYQRAGDAWNWAYKGIPLWFREGLASVAAGGEVDGSDLPALARFYRTAGAAEDPLVAPEALYRTHDDEVYGAAHHAFAYLLARHGEERVGAVLDLMGKGGLAFPEAFARAVGTTERAFVAEFRGYVERAGE